MIYLASLDATIEDKIEGRVVLDTLDAVYKLISDNHQANTLIIRADFSHAYFTPSGLSRFIDDARQINPGLHIEMDKTSTVITQDRFIDKVRQTKRIEDLILIAQAYPTEYFDTIHALTKSYDSLNNQLLEASSRVSKLQKTIDNLNAEKEDLEHALKIEADNKFITASKLNALVKRINYQYNIKVEEDKLFQVKDNKFDKVIYIKELSRVRYVDSFVYYLKEIFKVLYSMPTRLVVIESYYGTAKPALYPDLVPHYKLIERDVLTGDILMLGLQPMVMSAILQNSSNVSLLIILDRGGYIAPHVTGKNVEYFYTASDVKDIPEVVPKKRVISYSDQTLHIPYVKDFNKLDKSGQMSAYSSMPIIKQFIALVEGKVSK